MEMEDGGTFNWHILLRHEVHPTRIAILEAILCVGRELSSRELSELFSSPKMNLSHVSYHVRALFKKGVIVNTDERPVRGTTERFYYLADIAPTNTRDS